MIYLVFHYTIKIKLFSSLYIYRSKDINIHEVNIFIVITHASSWPSNAYDDMII